MPLTRKEAGIMVQRPTRVTATIACAIALGSMTLAQSVTRLERRPIVGHTGKSEFVLDSPQRLPGMAWPDYQETVGQFSSIRAVVPLREPISDEAKQVHYGLNVILPVEETDNIRNLSWVLIAGDDELPKLIVDLNGNGVLSDDTRIEFAESADGSYTAAHELKVVDSSGEGGEAVIPVLWSAKRNAGDIELYRYDWRERRGSIQILGETYGFALRTALPTFDARGSLVGIDLDQDGKIQFLRGDIEAFRADHEFLSVAGREFSISVDRHGGSLALTPTGRHAEARPPLIVGTKAPTLPSGIPLSGGDGRPLLLNFWSPRCSFSKRMAPRLREAWEELQNKQFVSITNEEADRVLTFSSSHGHEWPQIAGDEGEKLFDLYRVEAVPTYYVIDAEGVIRARGHTLEWLEIRSELDRLSSPESGEAP